MFTDADQEVMLNLFVVLHFRRQELIFRGARLLVDGVPCR